MAEAEEKPAVAAPKAGGPSVAMIGIVSFVAALVAVVAGGYINASLHPFPDMQVDKDGKITVIAPVGKSGHGKEGEGKPATFVTLDPPLVVNFEEGSAVRFLQTSVALVAKDEHAVEGIQKNMPLIRNNLLMLMSNRDYQSLMSREGKEKLRQEALTEVNNVEKKTGGPEVEDVLFTSFVVQ